MGLCWRCCKCVWHTCPLRHCIAVMLSPAKRFCHDTLLCDTSGRTCGEHILHLLLETLDWKFYMQINVFFKVPGFVVVCCCFVVVVFIHNFIVILVCYNWHDVQIICMLIFVLVSSPRCVVLLFQFVWIPLVVILLYSSKDVFQRAN